MSTPDQHAHVAGSWWASIAGWAYSLWSWFAGDANGLTVILSLITIALSAIKLVDALRRWRRQRTSGATLTEHIRAATRPGPLGDEP